MPHPLLIVSQSDHFIQAVDTNSHTEWQTVQIQISWLLKKPTDFDIHCFQRQGISGFSMTRVKMATSLGTNAVFVMRVHCNCALIACFIHSIHWLLATQKQGVWLSSTDNFLPYFFYPYDVHIATWQDVTDTLRADLVKFCWFFFYPLAKH